MGQFPYTVEPPPPQRILQLYDFFQQTHFRSGMHLRVLYHSNTSEFLNYRVPFIPNTKNTQNMYHIKIKKKML